MPRSLREKSSLDGFGVNKTLNLLTVFFGAVFVLTPAWVRAEAPRDEAHNGMVRIPAGEFLMGSDETEGRIGTDVGVDSIPKHKVETGPFWIDRFEVSIGDYRKFVKSTGKAAPAIWEEYKLFGYPPPDDSHPVVDVNFYEAEAYCQWAKKRLPSEAEWEKAARGTDGRIWPWGNELKTDRLNTESTKRRNWTSPVGSFPEGVSPFGLHDMAGNAMEWTSSILQSYPGGMRNLRPDKKFRILRGGSWGMPANPFGRVAHREYRLADLAQPDFGFRCVKDAK